MTVNMKNWDRVVRLILGVGALSFYGALAAPWRYFTLFGLILIGSALVGWCPLYTLIAKLRRPIAAPPG
jgi:hypothetical protein